MHQSVTSPLEGWGSQRWGQVEKEAALRREGSSKAERREAEEVGLGEGPEGLLGGAGA